MSYSHHTVPDRIRLLVLGDYAVGKSSVVSLLANGTVLKRARSTEGCCITVHLFSMLDSDRIIEFIEVGGADMYSISRGVFYQCHFHGIICVYDLSNKDSLLSLRNWLSEAHMHSSSASRKPIPSHHIPSSASPSLSSIRTRSISPVRSNHSAGGHNHSSVSPRLSSRHGSPWKVTGPLQSSAEPPTLDLNSDASSSSSSRRSSFASHAYPSSSSSSSAAPVPASASSLHISYPNVPILLIGNKSDKVSSLALSFDDSFDFADERVKLQKEVAAIDHIEMCGRNLDLHKTGSERLQRVEEFYRKVINHHHTGGHLSSSSYSRSGSHSSSNLANVVDSRPRRMSNTNIGRKSAAASASSSASSSSAYVQMQSSSLFANDDASIDDSSSIFAYHPD